MRRYAVVPKKNPAEADVAPVSRHRLYDQAARGVIKAIKAIRKNPLDRQRFRVIAWDGRPSWKGYEIDAAPTVTGPITDNNR